MLVAAMVAVLATTVVVSVAGLLSYCVDRSRRNQLLADRTELESRIRSVAPFVGGLAAVLVVNKGLQGPIEQVARTYGVEATALLYSIEGDFVAWFQSLFPDVATLYFAGMYVFGYGVLLTFPVVCYFFAESLRPLQTVVAAYTINYAIAVVSYAAVLAYGPRVYHTETDSAEPVSHGLVELFPDITGLLALANSETNVFPSLHAALSVTVLIVAFQTHQEFPRWTPIAAAIATSIVVATMALGIHWLVDVVAGVGLAVVSVVLARRLVAWHESAPTP